MWFFDKKSVPGERRSLAQMEEACAVLGNPQRSLRCVHVAGTNGKGSVCTKIAKAFDLAGYRVGLFTSPHICSFRERLQLNQQLISRQIEESAGNGLGHGDGQEGRRFFNLFGYIPEEDVHRLTNVIREQCSPLLTFFEITTLLAFLWYREQYVDIAILETGLGGRLDATNVCCPDLSIITSISFDHTTYLGTTLEAITREKAGIIKRGVPVLIGPRVPVDIVMEEARKCCAEVVTVSGTWNDYDQENAQIARRAIEFLGKSWKNIGDSIDEAMRARPPCRFQELDREIIMSSHGKAPFATILDVAHNPDGVVRLLMKAHVTFPNRSFVILLAISDDKDIAEMGRVFGAAACTIVCTRADSPRSMAAEKLAEIIQGVSAVKILVEENPSKAFHIAIDEAIEHDSILLATGTFYLMASVYRS